MKHPGVLILLILLLPVLPVRSQVTGEWIGAQIEFDLPRKFTLDAEIELRTLNPGGFRPYKYLGQIGLDYKINKRFDVGIKYRYSWRIEENMYYYPRHRIMADLKFDYPLGRFHFDYRARFQRITKAYIDSEFDRIPTLHLRNKIEFSYDIPDNKAEPALFFELFTPLNGYEPRRFDEYRVGAELKVPVAKKHDITGGIMYLHERTENALSGIIFRLSYKFTVD